MKVVLNEEGRRRHEDQPWSPHAGKGEVEGLWLSEHSGQVVVRVWWRGGYLGRFDPQVLDIV